MKKKQLSLLYVAALGLVLFAAGCGQASSTMTGYVMFGNPSSGPTTSNIAADSATTTPAPAATDAKKETDKEAKMTAEKDTAKIKADAKMEAAAVVKNSVSCIGEGACSKPTSLAANAPQGAIAVTFSYSKQTPNNISLIFKFADIVANQPIQKNNLVDGGQYTFGTSLTLDDTMYGPLGMQGTMMIPANTPGTVKNDGTTVTITMPLVPANAAATPGQ